MITKIDHRATVPYTAAQMYDLVNDVASYEKFLPYCKKSTVHRVNEAPSFMDATLVIDFNLKIPFFESIHQFNTRNYLHPHDKIVMGLSSGSLDALSGHWTFEKISSEETLVVLHLEITLKHTMLALALHAISGQVGKQLMEAFIQRAAEVYPAKETYESNRCLC
jgi:ribosome-associated toxin RatA of RatAB toxin-antitoxin module